MMRTERMVRFLDGQSMERSSVLVVLVIIERWETMHEPKL